jgi:hypothetical protein
MEETEVTKEASACLLHGGMKSLRRFSTKIYTIHSMDVPPW